MVRRSSLAVVGLVAAVALQQDTSAQSPTASVVDRYTVSLFDRFLDSLRQQASNPIPGLSAAIVQDGHIVWDRGYGMQDVESSTPARADTPYLIADLTQTFAAVLLMQCVERGTLGLGDPLMKWTPQAPTPLITIQQVLAHSNGGTTASAFRYDPARYSLLTSAVEGCGTLPARNRLVQEVFDRAVMHDSVPGRDLQDATADARQLFDQGKIDHYVSVLARLATPYKIDRRGRPVRSEYPDKRIDASTGLVSTVRDLASYDAALDDHLLMRPDLTAAMFANSVAGTSTLPTGLGWFAQTYNNERVIWHFGSSPDAFSSLILKVPGKKLTLILLANSDGLSAPFPLAEGDVTSSLFALAFLRLFLP